MTTYGSFLSSSSRRLDRHSPRRLRRAVRRAGRCTGRHAPRARRRQLCRHARRFNSRPDATHPTRRCRVRRRRVTAVCRRPGLRQTGQRYLHTGCPALQRDFPRRCHASHGWRRLCIGNVCIPGDRHCRRARWLTRDCRSGGQPRIPLQSLTRAHRTGRRWHERDGSRRRAGRNIAHQPPRRCRHGHRWHGLHQRSGRSPRSLDRWRGPASYAGRQRDSRTFGGRRAGHRCAAA
ncbi:MAG: MOSC domain-containing protein [Gemmatimonadetes bacterium]|nr:MOSC domain-containing protein [Gemmatimonadota bacterium]